MSCRIDFSNYRGSYYPGHAVEGQVICTFNSSKNIRGIKLKFVGQEYTHWTKTEKHYDTLRKRHYSRTEHYTGTNRFVQQYISLHGEGTIGPGCVEYPFQFMIPRGVPSSFKSQHGYIKYYIKATVDRPWSSDYVDEKTIVVASLIDFNDTPDVVDLNPTQYQDEKFVCCGCCASGPITMDVYLDKSAFILGETINVRTDITNMSNQTIKSLSVHLLMTIKEKVTSPRSDYKKYTKPIAAIEDTGVGAHGQRVYNLQIPISRESVIPNLKWSSLFEMWCTLMVKAILPQGHLDLKVPASVTIGHIPLRGVTRFPNDIGIVPTGILPPAYDQYDIARVHMQVPGGIPPSLGLPSSSTSGASAPPQEGMPSAPDGSKMGAGHIWTVFPETDDVARHPEGFPPSYDDVMKA